MPCSLAANFPNDVIEGLPKEFETGIYYGWAQVGDSTVHKMVMSVGWNPYYQNEKKSMVRRDTCFNLISLNLFEKMEKKVLREQTYELQVIKFRAVYI